MSLYAPRCAASCDRSWRQRTSSAAGTMPGVARGLAAARVADLLGSAGNAPTESFIGSKIGQLSQMITGTACTRSAERYDHRQDRRDCCDGGQYQHRPDGPSRLMARPDLIRDLLVTGDQLPVALLVGFFDSAK
jgi:hypothetical protein